MRINQLNLLNDDELSLLVYIINIEEPIQSPNVEIKNKTDLLWIQHDALLMKLLRQESKLTDEGKEIFKNLMIKLNKTVTQEHEEYENSIRLELTQPEPQL